MPVANCKICGGSIDLPENLTYAVCPYCNTTTTFPVLSDEYKASLYNQADALRQNKDFDNALNCYDKILEYDNTDPEIYWGKVLCRYGIIYVEDPNTHERVPTSHAGQASAILTDPDYSAALQYARENENYYALEAKRISEIKPVVSKKPSLTIAHSAPAPAPASTSTPKPVPVPATTSGADATFAPPPTKDPKRKKKKKDSDFKNYLYFVIFIIVVVAAFIYWKKSSYSKGGEKTDTAKNAAAEKAGKKGGEEKKDAAPQKEDSATPKEDAKALFESGERYYKEKKYKEAVEYFEKAAAQDFAQAQNWLGICYYTGNGVSKDYNEAVKWYTKAAEQGFANAQYNLGLCYANGKGVDKDLNKAKEWYKKAADQGNAKAKKALKKLK